MRLTEGIAVYRQNAGSKLMLSGFKGRDQISNAEAMASVALEQGVPVSDIIMESEPKDTAEEAATWAGYLQAKRFALVTSASHMPRAVALFEYQGLKPIPAPTVFLSGGHHGFSWRSLFPSAGAINIVESAWHEYLGISWAKLQSLL